jgi:hypothetical protein
VPVPLRWSGSALYRILVLFAEAVTLILPFKQTAAPPAEVEKLDAVNPVVEGNTVAAWGACGVIAAAEETKSVTATEETNSIEKRKGILTSTTAVLSILLVNRDSFIYVYNQAPR